MKKPPKRKDGTQNADFVPEHGLNLGAHPIS